MAGSAGARRVGRHRPVGQRQVLHSLVDPGQGSPGQRQVTRHPRAAAQHQGVEGRPQLIGGDIGAGLDPAAELVPSARIWASRRSRCRFSSLNSGMPYRSSPPSASSRSKTVTVCPALVSCWAAASPAGPEPITATVCAGQLGRGHRGHPAGRERPVDDLHLDLLDRDRVGIDPEHAGGFARRWAKPPGELGEVVRGVQAVGGVLPVMPPNQVVPLGDEVPERAAVMAERDAAVHAPARLAFQAAGRERLVHLPPVRQPQVDRAAGRGLAGRGQEALRVSHVSPPYPCAAAMTAWSTSRPSRSACDAADSTRL